MTPLGNIIIMWVGEVLGPAGSPSTASLLLWSSGTPPPHSFVAYAHAFATPCPFAVIKAMAKMTHFVP
ncbi:MAG: hypothetical protein A2566_01510 [Candidatus Zambryskibacteria bacterium RIFOXYD1_FULL_40_13]|nr:MAG: hypothetical protein UT25_C0001G0003 [Parcubacteria group bacterium GW2011_GWC1_39_12]KKR19527.1 MAG: hypothetical protein UT49_C0001G0003 [Parcubacteria group bacterium GW2011_GWF1_39_37]KKR35680.1 MAG: hypothetical protein UT68_C0001G0003 [Parcubacteria group bacterium GW2011_GWC2_40_10]KKR52495.1 MAG: hypothetical protein UT89_C0001G0003 [Parcubacteria group bacterium GW2011_GWE1_40_20]KKR65488.1 MAG: hypothetical protein UU06_C0017G0002 [Parcubacteria group bacterium GW2011_GWB1_40_